MTTTATTVHHFERPAADTAEICACGAAFVEGYHREAVKIAHLSAFLSPTEVAAAMVAPLTPGQLDDVITGRVRLGLDRTLDLAVWNAAITEEQNR